MVSFGVGCEGKRSQHSRRMRNLQCYVSGKRPIECRLSSSGVGKIDLYQTLLLVYIYICIYIYIICYEIKSFNTLRPRQNGRHFPDDNFKRIFFNEDVKIPIRISLKFVPKGPIDNIPSLVQIMAWRRAGHKPLFEPKMVNLLKHICVTRPQWVKHLFGNTL